MPRPTVTSLSRSSAELLLVADEETLDRWLAFRLHRYLGLLERSALPGVLPASTKYGFSLGRSESTDESPSPPLSSLFRSPSDIPLLSVEKLSSGWPTPSLFPLLALDIARDIVRAAAAAVGDDEKASSEAVVALVVLASSAFCTFKSESSWLGSSTVGCFDAFLLGSGVGGLDFGFPSDCVCGFEDAVGSPAVVDADFFGESKTNVSSSAAAPRATIVGIGDMGGTKLESRSCRCSRTACSASESECRSSRMLWPSAMLLSKELSGAELDGFNGGMFSSLSDTGGGPVGV